MKLKYILTVAAIALFASCSQIEIDTYNDLTKYRFISFTKAESSESNVSFFQYPGETTINYPVVVQSSGYGEDDMEYKVSVIAENTTAQAGDYTMPEKFVFRKKSAVDTFYVQLHYSEKLDTEKVKVSLKIEANEFFKEGIEDNLKAVIWFHNNLVKPAWWSTIYFGTYSDLKYKYFLQVVKKDLTDANNSTKRHYALIFKAWLQEQADAGNTITEANGTPMTIPAGGGSK